MDFIGIANKEDKDANSRFLVSDRIGSDAERRSCIVNIEIIN